MIEARKKREIRLNNYNPKFNSSMVDNEKSCLIIGDGPSQKYIDMNAEYNVDAIVCIHQPKHKYTNFVFSADATKFKEKEGQCIARNIPLIIAEGTYLPEKVPNLQIFKSKRQSPISSGFIPLEWAISQGYKNIYTAGLDFKREGGTIHKYLDNTIINVINDYIYNHSMQVNFFKVSPESLLCANVRTPEQKKGVSSPPQKKVQVETYPVVQKVQVETYPIQKEICKITLRERWY